jgi:hypothetical protein
MARCKETLNLLETLGDDGLILMCDLAEFHSESFHVDALHDMEWRPRRAYANVAVPVPTGFLEANVS